MRCLSRGHLIRNWLLRIVLICHAVFIAVPAWAAMGHDPIEGVWMTEDKNAAVEFYHCDSKICGRFHWVKEDDSTNDAGSHHERSTEKTPQELCHMQFIGGFSGDGKGHYADGWITSPNDGATYDADITLMDRETMKLHGYLWLPILGESQIWKRASSVPGCKSP